MEDKLVTINEVCQRFSIHRSTYYRWVKEASGFPKPIKLGGNSIRHRLKEIEAYEEAMRCCDDAPQILH